MDRHYKKENEFYQKIVDKFLKIFLKQQKFTV